MDMVRDDAKGHPLPGDLPVREQVPKPLGLLGEGPSESLPEDVLLQDLLREPQPTLTIGHEESELRELLHETVVLMVGQVRWQRERGKLGHDSNVNSSKAILQFDEGKALQELENIIHRGDSRIEQLLVVFAL